MWRTMLQVSEREDVLAALRLFSGHSKNPFWGYNWYIKRFSLRTHHGYKYYITNVSGLVVGAPETQVDMDT